MTLDAKIRPLAQRLIQKFGKSATYKAVTGGTYDPATGTFTGAGSTDHPLKGVVSSFDAFLIDGTLIQAQDLKFSCAALDLPVTPIPGDRLVIDGESFAVVHPNPMYSGEMVAMWELQVRK